METTDRSQKTIDLVKEIADKMRDPLWVKQRVLDPNNQKLDPAETELYWSDLSIAGGYPGVIPLFAELDSRFPEEKWDEAAHAYVLKIKESIEQSSIRYYSLYGGLAGTCWSLYQASRQGSRYNKLLATLNGHLLNKVQNNYIIPLKENIAKERPSDPSLYELIQGLAGIGVYGLSHRSDPHLADMTRQILRILVDLTKPIHWEGRSVPGWYVPVDFLSNEGDKKHYPKGNFNLGLSHGITGILALLSIAVLRGFSVEGQLEAIERVSFWLKERRRMYKDTYFWEPCTSFENEKSNQQNETFLGRDAWCYGTPGVSRSLFLAGKALNSETLKQTALDSFRSVFSRSREEQFLPGPTFCHGIAGLLMITSLMARDTLAIDLQEKTETLQTLLLEYYQQENPFGFTDFSPVQNKRYSEINKAALLEGSSGVLLTLLSLKNSSTWWHAPFLIDEGEDL